MTITRNHIAMAHISINSNDRLTAAEKSDALQGLALLAAAANNGAVTVRNYADLAALLHDFRRPDYAGADAHIHAALAEALYC
nr:MAG TPA: hypothetical protein [Caudoviricetes sp.]